MTNYEADEATAARHDAADDYDVEHAADHLDPSEWDTVQRPTIRRWW